MAGAVRTQRVLRSPALIGTHEGSDIRLTGAEGVNRRHALLARYFSSWAIHDLGSVNGVRHNNKRLQRADIAVGDEVRLGKAILTVVEDGPPPSRAPNKDDDDWAANILSDDTGTVFAARCL